MRLLWHFKNEQSTTIFNLLKKKSTFNAKAKYEAIDLYSVWLKEDIMVTETKFLNCNLIKEECLALKLLRDDTPSIIKVADCSNLGQRGLLEGSRKTVGDKETNEELS